MKILQINSVCGVGSTGKIATDLYKVLEEEGHQCKIAYGRGTAPEGIDSIKIGSNIDNYLHVFKTRLFDKHGFGSVKATKKFIEEVKKFDPDIIHLHNIHGYYINIEVLFDYLKEANKPVIWTLHDCWAFTGHCAYFDFVGCDKWKNQCGECPQKSGYPSSKFTDNSKLNYEKKKALFTSVKNMTIVTPSMWLANLVEKSFLGKYKVKTIKNGIDLHKFRPTYGGFRKIHNIENKYVVLGVAAIWDKRKGLEYFIKLSNELNDKYKIVLVGVNENQKRELPDNIIGITRTEDIKSLAEIYTSADLFVNPTLEEVMGLVNVEALACGTPVLTFNTGGSVECIDKNCGIISEKYNIRMLKYNIEHICENNLFNQKNCIERSKMYNNRTNYYQYINLYKENINGK